MPLTPTKPDAPRTGTLPPTCSLKGLLAFGPGFHKDEFYSPEQSARVPQNFKYLTGTVPTAKLGHDVQQRFTQSLGFPNVGIVTRCDAIPGYPGIWDVDVDDVPTEVGGHANTGFFKSASVELKPEVRDPNDQSRKIGPVLTGISLLGEEPPAVRNFPPELQDRARPRATFDDGRPVPPGGSGSVKRLFDAMADVTRKMAAEYGGEFDPDRRVLRLRGREYAASVACFSDFNPVETAMTLEQKTALAAAGFTPEQIAKFEATLVAPPAPEATLAPPPGDGTDQFSVKKGDGTSSQAKVMWGNDPDDDDADTRGSHQKGEYERFAAQCKKYADDPKATPDQKMMAAMYGDFSTKFADMTKRFGAVEAATTESQKKDEGAKMAAFSDQVATAVKRVARKLPPAVIKSTVEPEALRILTAKTFSAEADRVKAFNDYFAGFEALPDNPLLKDVVNDAKPKQPATSEGLATLIGPGSFLDRQFGTADMRKRLNVAG